MRRKLWTALLDVLLLVVSIPAALFWFWICRALWEVTSND